MSNIIIPEFTPETMREDITGALREQFDRDGKASPATVELGSLTLTLQNCMDGYGNVIWDREDVSPKMCAVTATTPDGETVTLQNPDTWNLLEVALAKVAVDWEDPARRALVEVDRAREGLVKAEQQLQQARVVRDRAAQSAVALGITPYRVAKVGRMSQTTVARIVR